MGAGSSKSDLHRMLLCLRSSTPGPEALNHLYRTSCLSQVISEGKMLCGWSWARNAGLCLGMNLLGGVWAGKCSKLLLLPVWLGTGTWPFCFSEAASRAVSEAKQHQQEPKLFTHHWLFMRFQPQDLHEAPHTDRNSRFAVPGAMGNLKQL